MKTAQWIMMIPVLLLEEKAKDPVNDDMDGNNAGSHYYIDVIPASALCTVTLN